MRTETMEIELSVVQEPQLDILYYPRVERKSASEKQKERLNVLSLFSGCGGMDLGFEGGFSVLPQSINEILTPHFIDKKEKNGFVKLKKTKFSHNINTNTNATLSPSKTKPCHQYTLN